MLEYIADEERKQKIKEQIELLKHMHRVRTIDDQEYENEMLMLADECEFMEKRKAELNGEKYTLDDMFDNPMSEIDELITQARDLYDKKVHEAIEEVENESGPIFK